MLPVRTATLTLKTSTRSSKGPLSTPCARSAVRSLVTGCRAQEQLGAGSPASQRRRGEDLDRGDPGSWEHSPEWMGSQGGGWGRDAGMTVFSTQSQHGNGVVSVTAHAASRQDPPPGTGLEGGARAWQEWRTLRFNEATRQSVAKVWVHEGVQGGGGREHAQPECLAMEYLKSMASAAAAILGLTGTASRACDFTGAAHSSVSAVCIGVGGGSLPAFLAHHYPGMRVEAVELDPVVVQAATSAMGFPDSRPNLRMHNEEGASFLARRAREVEIGSREPIDLLFLDVFDGADDIPPAFTAPGSKFLAHLSAALHPSHGTLVANMHCGDRPNLGAALLRTLRGQAPQLIDVEAPDGREVLRVASLFREALPGVSYICAAEKQCNAVVVASRHPRATSVDDICRAADVVGRTAGYTFDAGRRAGLGFMAV